MIGTMASAVLSHRLDQVGTALGLSEGLLGLITALGADSPEIASALTALVSGQHDLGKSVILGSNIFNLASLLGLSALLAGSVVCGVKTLLLNAGVSLWVTVVVACQMVLGLPPLWAGLLIAAVMIPYVIVSAMKPAQIGRVAMPGPLRRWLREAVSDTEVDAGDEQRPHTPSWADKLAIVPLLTVVVLTSIGMVKAASFLGARWGLSEVVLGALVLATLTGIPNVVAAIRLAVQGRGSAVVSETFNSNSLNLLAGAYLPTLFLPVGTMSPTARLTLWCLLGTTLIATLLFLRRGRMNRIGGGVLIAAYAGFVVLLLR
ncbi:hypothetical protein HN018_23995 (plasmid) [Lichenicola cladoniae]|uniref:Sodium/calcium exchanger membrane region domain-containing protein n=1 Tax=Lichenicola cladoniae TaxID=1484109 RepID=A0A6M8HXH2_9PROT|nr:hypothetical protein [Lichenicola cladoniae]NPD69823.1 hypothetical protein [Acetobacteraceae bacterium]QKE93239.1 hypothetical protein HN018_23995 [Lichenicola cladoniae]